LPCPVCNQQQFIHRGQAHTNSQRLPCLTHLSPTSSRQRTACGPSCRWPLPHQPAHWSADPWWAWRCLGACSQYRRPGPCCEGPWDGPRGSSRRRRPLRAGPCHRVPQEPWAQVEARALASSGRGGHWHFQARAAAPPGPRGNQGAPPSWEPEGTSLTGLCPACHLWHKEALHATSNTTGGHRREHPCRGMHSMCRAVEGVGG
jgi:hypothetical protein